MRKMMIAALAVFLSVGMAGLVMAAGNEKTVTGNLRDSFCYTVMGAHGPSHRQCALKCARAGIPVALVPTGSSNMMYILLPHKDQSSLPADIINNMEKQVTVTGKEYTKDGVHFLRVDTVK